MDFQQRSHKHYRGWSQQQQHQFKPYHLGYKYQGRHIITNRAKNHLFSVNNTDDDVTNPAIYDGMTITLLVSQQIHCYQHYHHKNEDYFHHHRRRCYCLVGRHRNRVGITHEQTLHQVRSPNSKYLVVWAIKHLALIAREILQAQFCPSHEHYKRLKDQVNTHSGSLLLLIMAVYRPDFELAIEHAQNPHQKIMVKIHLELNDDDNEDNNNKQTLLLDPITRLIINHALDLSFDHSDSHYYGRTLIFDSFTPTIIKKEEQGGSSEAASFVTSSNNNHSIHHFYNHSVLKNLARNGILWWVEQAAAAASNGDSIQPLILPPHGMIFVQNQYRLFLVYNHSHSLPLRLCPSSIHSVQTNNNEDQNCNYYYIENIINTAIELRKREKNSRIDNTDDDDDDERVTCLQMLLGPAEGCIIHPNLVNMALCHCEEQATYSDPEELVIVWRLLDRWIDNVTLNQARYHRLQPATLVGLCREQATKQFYHNWHKKIKLGSCSLVLNTCLVNGVNKFLENIALTPHSF